MLNTMSKIRGQVKNPGYPQAEGLLGECMSKYGRELGEDTNFGKMQVPMCGNYEGWCVYYCAIKG